MSERPPHWKRVLFPLAPLAVILLGSELALRMVSPAWMACVRTRACPAHDSDPVFYTQHRGNFVVETGEPLSIYHPTRFWWPRPHVRGTVRATPQVRTNSLGFRDYEIDESPGKRNILLVGDSVLWGSLVLEEERFSSRTAELLTGDSISKKVQLVNAAVVGYSSFQVLQYIKEEGLSRFDPEVLVVCAGINDNWLFNRSDVESYRANIAPLSRLKHVLMQTNVFLFLYRYLNEFRTWVRTGHNPEGLSFLFRERWNPQRVHRDAPFQTIANFRKIGALAGRSGAQMVVILEDVRDPYPDNWDPAAFRTGRSRLEELALAKGWSVIRISDLRRPPRNLQPAEYFIDFCHLNTLGNEIIAVWLADTLTRRLEGKR